MFDPAKYIEEPIPFKPHGRTPQEGFDCWGLLHYVYAHDLGVEVESFNADYQSIKDHDRLEELITANLEPDWLSVDQGQERPGDGVLIRMDGQPIHVGVVVEGGRFMHVHAGVNVCVESYRSAKWKNRILGIYRHRKLW